MGHCQGQERQPLSPRPPLEQTAVLPRGQSPLNHTLPGGNVPEAACLLEGSVPQ